MFSQPTFVLIGALAFAIFVTALFGSTQRRDSRRHAGVAIAAIALTGFVACAAVLAGVRWNITASMPVGLYRANPKSTIQPGTLVAVCAPETAVRTGRERGYLGSGPCPNDTEALLKMVVAIAGDSVSISSTGIRINGRLLPNSRPLGTDSAGRSLQTAAPSQIIVPRDSLWLYADHPRSWDSRYWGVVPTRNVIVELVPLLVLPSSSTY